MRSRREASGWRREASDIDGVHPCGDDGGDAEVGVFEGLASGRFDAEAAGGFEEDVGGGFLAGDVLVGDDGGEPIEDAEVLEDSADGAAGAAGGDGHGELSAVLAGDIDDLFDGADVGEAGEIFGFLFVGDLEGVEVGAVLFGGEHAEDIAGGDAAEGVEAVFGEVEAVAAGDDLPGFEVEGHGVGEGAVTIEDEGVVGEWVAHGVGTVRVGVVVWVRDQDSIWARRWRSSSAIRGWMTGSRSPSMKDWRL